jgi:hypothetical protein
VAIVPAFDRWGDLIEPLLKALECLGLKGGPEDGQNPHQRSPLHVVELVGTHLAVHLAGLLDDARQGVEGVTDS